MCTLADGYVTVRGERSRYFGPDAAPGSALSSASTNLGSDLYFRGVREAGTVEKLLRQPAPAGPGRQVKELMRGFAAGYNAWLKQNRVTDPACAKAAWVRPITALDAARQGFAVQVLGGQGRGIDGIAGARPPGATGKERGRTADPHDAGPPGRAVLGAGADMGSNAVAFHGRTTANGKGLLLGNPHYPWQGGRRFCSRSRPSPVN